MFAKVLLGYSAWLLGSCYAVAGVLLDSLQTFPPLVITENQTLFSKLIQFQCIDLVLMLGNAKVFVALKLALKRDLYHLSSLCNINRTACLL